MTDLSEIKNTGTTKDLVEVKIRKCLDCGGDFETREAKVLGLKNPIVFGGKYCRECGQKKRKDSEKREAEEQERQISSQRENWRNSCGIPRRFQTVRFETFKANRSSSLLRAFGECVEYADNFPFKHFSSYRSMLLFSDSVWGIGKTHLAAAICHRILDRWQGDSSWCPILYISEPEIFGRLRDTYNNRNFTDVDRETETNIYRKLTTAPLLVIDDMGKEEVADSRFVQRVLFRIINGRYDNMLPVFITANLNPSRLEKYLGGNRDNEATFNRLLEMTENKFNEIQATTYRDYANR